MADAAASLAGGAVRHRHARHQARRGRPRAAERPLGDSGRVEGGGHEWRALNRRFKTRGDGRAGARCERRVPPLSDAGRRLALRMQTRTQGAVPRSDRRVHDQGAARGEGAHQLAESGRRVRARRSQRFVDAHARSRRPSRSSRRFVPFQARVAEIGIYNSLAQLVIKITAPGVPDFYQGTELWDLNLVDPDNRRPVDYDAPRGRARSTGARASLAGRSRACSSTRGPTAASSCSSMRPRRSARRARSARARVRRAATTLPLRRQRREAARLPLRVRAHGIDRRRRSRSRACRGWSRRCMPDGATPPLGRAVLDRHADRAAGRRRSQARASVDAFTGRRSATRRRPSDRTSRACDDSRPRRCSSASRSRCSCRPGPLSVRCST